MSSKKPIEDLKQYSTAELESMLRDAATETPALRSPAYRKITSIHRGILREFILRELEERNGQIATQPILIEGVEYEWKTLGGLFRLYPKALTEWPKLDVSSYQPKTRE